MQVTVSVGGKFHAFYLANQLHKRGVLQRFITSYPKFEGVRSGIPRDKVSSYMSKELVQRMHKKLPGFLKDRIDPRYWLSEIYDLQVSHSLAPTDIFVGWSSFSLHSMDVAHRSGSVLVLERGSSHIECQRDLLIEEYESVGLQAALTLPHDRVVEKELSEYELADYIVVPSSFAKQSFLQKGIPEEKLKQIPYGVDLREFEPGNRSDSVFRIILAVQSPIGKACIILLRRFEIYNCQTLNCG